LDGQASPFNYVKKKKKKKGKALLCLAVLTIKVYGMIRFLPNRHQMTPCCGFLYAISKRRACVPPFQDTSSTCANFRESKNYIKKEKDQVGIM
jgi:hypothetical protein